MIVIVRRRHPGSGSSAPGHRASGLWSWTGPLRDERRRHARLARASLRCAVLSLLAALVLLFGGRHGGSLDGTRLLFALAPALLAVALGWLGVRARREVELLEVEIDRLEAEAIRALEERS